MNGVYLRYIDIPPTLKNTLNNYSLTNSSNVLSTISLANLKKSQPDQINYATFEHNYWKLDGTYRGITGKSTLIWGTGISSDTTLNPLVYVIDTTLYLEELTKSEFSQKPVLTRNWSGYQTAPGLYIIFYGPDFCTDLNIKWYRDNTLLADENYSPDNVRYFCRKRVELFNKCVITFNAMNKENRFLKVVDLWDGNVVEFYNKDLRNVSIIEEYDPISDTLPINTMNVGFSHKTDELELVFQNKQIIEAYHNDVLYGKFFIDKSSDKYNVSATDYKGLLEKSVFLGNFYNNASVTTIINDILADEENIKYDIPSAFNSIYFTGPIKKCTKREALAQVLFAIGGYADDSRSDTLEMRQSGGEAGPYMIPKDKTFLSGRNVLNESPVTEVRLTVHSYKQSADAKELFSSQLNAGTYTIEFSDPVVLSTLTVSGATVVTRNAFYVTITVASTATVTVNAKVYEDNSYVVSKRNSLVLSGIPTNIVEYTDKSLVTAKNSTYVNDLLNWLAYYHSFNTKYETKVKATNKIHTLANIYPDRNSEANTGLITKYDYKLRRNQIGTVTMLLNYEGEY